MGKGIDIIKYDELNGIHYYYIAFGDSIPTFYIAIDPVKNVISFFKDNDFSKTAIGIVDFNNQDPFESIPMIPDVHKNYIFMTLTRARLAILKREFPDYIGFSS